MTLDGALMQTAQQWVLPKQPTSPGSARRRLAAACAGLPQDLVETVLLLTSELVTNAVKYGGDQIVLTVRDEPGRVTVEVYDDGPRAPRIGAGARQAEGGRGLRLVESLAHEWGTVSDRPGKSVWFTLRKVA
jgi:anti-sigma regulatory factor (Ser/Thr protein kinase)